MAAPRKVAILGAGSVGCFIGGAWHAAGIQVTLIGRDRIRREIAEHGLSLSDLAGWKRRLPPPEVDFTTGAAPLKHADLIALCVKSNDTADAAKLIGRHGRKGAVVVSFQNGISNAATLKAMLPKFDIVSGMIPFNVAWLGPGRLHKGVSGDLVAGDHPALTALAERIPAGPARLRIAQDMAAIAWGKLLLNLNNAINALSGKTLLDQLSERNYRRILAAAMIETLDLLKAAGTKPAQLGPVPPHLLPHAIAAPDFIFRNLLLRTQKIDAKARSSMADDFAASRPTEIDHLNGEVVKLAASLGRKAPINQAIVDLVRQYEAGVERMWSAKELREHVLGGRATPLFGY